MKTQMGFRILSVVAAVGVFFLQALFAQTPRDRHTVHDERNAAAGTELRGQNDTLRIDTVAADTLAVDLLDKDAVEDLHPLEWEQVDQDRMIARLLEAHRETVGRQRGIPGYRVHLFMDSGNRARLNTQREQADFEEKHPDHPSYIVYEEPYFKLRAGDFRTRLDARRFLEKVRRDYPAAYIVVDRINFPELE